MNKKHLLIKGTLGLFLSAFVFAAVVVVVVVVNYRLVSFVHNYIFDFQI